MRKVTILGAGPAGSSAAIQLLKAGHQVTIIDRVKFPRHAPGETLHPGVEPLLKQLGVWEEIRNANFLRHTGIENTSNGIGTFEAYNEEESWKGFQLFREEFDNILLKKAIELGAAFKPNITPSGLIMNGEHIKAVKTAENVYEADYFVDATGKRAWLATEMGVEYKRIGSQKIAYFGYVKDASLNPINPIIEWDENGWTWIAQVKDNQTAWVRLDLDEHRKMDNNWIPPKLRDGRSTGTRKAVDVTWRIAGQCSIGNCFLVGDASFVLDPGSSHGVLKAIMSGMMAAHLMEQTGTHSMAKVHQHYNSWVRNQFNHDIEKLMEMYEKYEIKTNANNV